ncbi:hypothetical protein BCON_0001g00250 [Botryotinia convoluta]|uniref:Uncharacterized protein n=1 Tax=Botryotinia convoluta TaxID=54673 RepID=A0A4Z1IWF2_9HELO|nr:hypothetical protein BCON_0001g00250 [Botryotinia convoluta]
MHINILVMVASLYTVVLANYPSDDNKDAVADYPFNPNQAGVPDVALDASQAAVVSGIVSSLSAFSTALDIPSSLASELSNIPTSASTLGYSPTGVSQLDEQLSGTNKPDWYTSLSPDAKSYVDNAVSILDSVYSLESILTTATAWQTTPVGVVDGMTAIPLSTWESTWATSTKFDDWESSWTSSTGCDNWDSSWASSTGVDNWESTSPSSTSSKAEESVFGSSTGTKDSTAAQTTGPIEVTTSNASPVMCSLSLGLALAVAVGLICAT